ncbi:MAG: ribbon-helix-helix domain-containing protein [Gammaproteobacteria bacterium]|nr:ribbon-helix-helix domain-containing protein [Gammaproteobacteria bacterium]
MAAKIRFSVALDEHEYAELAVMAEKHRVSMAWLVRHALTEFLDRYRSEDLQLPLRLVATRPERHNA